MIKKCNQKDKEPGKPWCLYTKDGKKLLGRHPTKESALEQERAIFSQKGSILKRLSRIIEYLFLNE